MEEFEIRVDIPDKDKLIKRLENYPDAMGKALKRTVADFKTRAPGWVAASVAEQYTVKKAEVRNAIKAKEKAGAIKVGKVSVDGARIKYAGGMLTPTRFQMSPKTRPAKKYKVKAKIKKNGTKKVLSSRAFLGSSNGEGSTQIPFQRTGKDRLPIEAIKTVSVPQMIENEAVASAIGKKLSEGLSKRMEHNMEQAIKEI